MMHNWKHGLTHTRFHNIWKTMRSRCTHPKNSEWERYGGRGITVCERWGDFLNFRDDMYVSFLRHVDEHGEKRTSIDRVDNSLGYSLANCKWATPTEQARNTRRNRMFTIRGVTKSLPEWVEIYGASYDRVKARLKYGWEIERALTTGKLINQFL